MTEWLEGFLSTAGFMPHGHCYIWNPWMLALQVGTNASIGVAYVAIAVTLAYLVRSIHDIPFRWVYIAFGVFIITCAFTHFMDVWVIYHPHYWVDVSIRSVTAVASVGTAVLLPPLVPQVLALARAAKTAHDRGIRLESAVADLEQLYQRATELDEAKTRFFANVSHELRTPVTLIIGPLERLVSRDDVPEDVRREGEIALRNARTLCGHVEDLLTASRLDAGESQARYTPADLARLIRAAAANFDGVAAERGIDYTVDAPPALEAEVDVPRVRRVALNLLSNAFKFTPDGGRIRISLRPEGDSARLEVADSGPGIPPQERQRVFERFRQVDATVARRFGGTGLGLSIVHDFVTLHGGEVTVGDAPEGGALLCVLLPLHAPPGAELRAPTDDDRVEPRRPAAVTAADRGHGPRGPEGRPLVLVVDDDADMRAFIEAVLSRDNRVATATNGREALDRVRALRPDVLLTDIMMPEMAGDELVRAVRADPSIADLPILVLSARADDEMRVETLRSGAQDWVTKPFHPEEIRARIAIHVELKRARDVLSEALEMRGDDVEALARELTARKLEVETALQETRVARALAERSAAVKSSFLRAVSHELRGPLNTLNLRIELLLRDREATEPQRQSYERLRTTLLQMRDMVENVLQKVRVEGAAVRLTPSRFDAGQLAREVVEVYRNVADQKSLRLEVEDHEAGPFFTDRDVLRVVISNLVHNAVKFTDHGTVRVELEGDVEGQRVTVTDTGPGIPHGERERVFQPFAQAEHRRRAHQPGLGLGLSLVRELVDVLGGEVALHDIEEGGTRFVVSLPPSPPEEPS